MTDLEFRAHLDPKPCKFCGQAVPYRPLEEMEQHGVKVYFCNTCQAEYLYFDTGAQASISLYTKINDRLYRWTVSNARTAQLWLINNPGVPGTRVDRDLVPVKMFGISDDIPELTPSNINNKLRTWLVFL